MITVTRCKWCGDSIRLSDTRVNEVTREDGGSFCPVQKADSDVTDEYPQCEPCTPEQLMIRKFAERKDTFRNRRALRRVRG